MPSRRHSLLRCTYSPKRSHAVTIEGTGTGARCCDGEVRAIAVDGENVERPVRKLGDIGREAITDESNPVPIGGIAWIEIVMKSWGGSERLELAAIPIHDEDA